MYKKSKSTSRFGFILIFSYLFLTLIGVRILEGEGHVLDISDTGESDFLKQILFVLVFFATVFYWIAKRAFFRISQTHLLIFLFFFYAGITIFWSNVPAISFKRYILTLFVFFIPFFIALSFDYSFIIKSVMISLCIIILLSFFASILHPNGVHTYSALDAQLIGSWKGVFTHKNRAGAAASFLCGLLLIFYFFDRKKVYLILFSLCFLFLYKTMSKTSLLILAPSLLVSYTLYKYNSYVKWYFVVSGLLMLSPFLYFVLQYFAEVVNSPEAFTGRGDIWGVVAEVIEDNPIFGVGIASVYHVGEMSILLDYTGSWVSLEAHGHNGYLDLMLYLGLPGFFAFCFIFIRNYFNLVFRAQRSNAFKNRDCLLFYFVGSFLIFHNFFETSYFDTTRHGWVFMSTFYSLLLANIVNKNMK